MKYKITNEPKHTQVKVFENKEKAVEWFKNECEGYEEEYKIIDEKPLDFYFENVEVSDRFVEYLEGLR